jgi:RnfABCDGE-type electron transport complex B subunit
MIEVLIPAGVMGGLGLLLSLALLLAAKRFYVYEDPRIGQVEELLPGANCGGCGKAGCKAFAEALVAGEDGNCPVCGQDAMTEIARLLGKELGGAEPLVAHVMCEGLLSSASFNGMYQGIDDCRAAHLVGQVDRVCSYGCIGMGTCVEACAFDAIETYNHIARVIPENCVACGKCVEACPRELIVMIPKGRQVFIPCKSFDSGKVVSKVCEIGCIGCRKCVKACPSDAIWFDDNLAEINLEKCTQCYECVVACPRHLIKVRDLAEFVVTEDDLKQGFDTVAEALWTERAREKAEAEQKRRAELAAGGEDPEIAAKRAKFQKGLDDARAKAASDPEYAAKLPKIEAGFLKKLAELGPPPDTAPAADPELEAKRQKIQQALDAARAKAESDPEYAKKFPRIEAGFKAKLAALDPESRAGEHDAAEVASSQSTEEAQ